MHQKRKKHQRKRPRKSNWLLGAILVLILVITGLLVAQYGVIEDLRKNFDEPELLVIEDRCSVIMDNLLHQLKTEEECHITCRNECIARDKDIYKTEFIEREASCHTCNCYCQ